MYLQNHILYKYVYNKGKSIFKQYKLFSKLENHIRYTLQNRDVGIKIKNYKYYFMSNKCLTKYTDTEIKKELTRFFFSEING